MPQPTHHASWRGRRRRRYPNREKLARRHRLLCPLLAVPQKALTGQSMTDPVQALRPQPLRSAVLRQRHPARLRHSKMLQILLLRSRQLALRLHRALRSRPFAVIRSIAQSDQCRKYADARALTTGLRLSEMTGLKRHDLVLGAGAHVRVIGKGRKERCTPVARSTLAVLKAWLREPQRGEDAVLFPSAKGCRLSVHGVQYLLNKHRTAASKSCPSLKQKRVTVHRLRHTMAMDLLQAGVDRAVIALWLGHESVETTQIYLEATLAMKEHALAKTTPLQARPGRYQPGDRLLGFLNTL